MSGPDADRSDLAAREQAARVDGLLGELEMLPAGPRELALRTVEELLTLYGSGLARIMALAQSANDGFATRLGRDDLVGHLLLLHGLHPERAETRINRALEGVRSRLRQIGRASCRERV